MSIQPVSHKNVLQNCVQSLVERLYEVARAIRDCVVRIFNALFCCRSSGKELPVGDLTDAEVLAEHITVAAMQRLNMGILECAAIPNRFNQSLDGSISPVIGTKYDPNCPLIQKMRPAIAAILEQEFAKGEKSLAQGFTLVLREANGNRLLPVDAAVNLAVQKIISGWGLNSLDWRLHIKQDQKRFIVDEFFNGARVGNTGMSVAGARDAVQHRFVTTFRT